MTVMNPKYVMAVVIIFMEMIEWYCENIATTQDTDRRCIYLQYFHRNYRILYFGQASLSG